MNSYVLGDALKQLRKQHSITQIELAKKSGISRSQIILIETGAEINPGLDTLEKLGNAVGYEVVITFEPIVVEEEK